MLRHRSSRRWRAVLAGTTAALAAGLASWGVLGPTSALAGTITGTLYRAPGSAVVNWVNANPHDHRMPAIRDRIANQPTAVWWPTFNPNEIQGQVSSYVTAANNAGQIPQMVLYNIPRRDCGQYSAGGAPNVAIYGTWITNLAKGLGNKTVIILLESDSLALQSCLNATEINDRNNAIASAVRTIKAANPNAKVYLDGGHSAWNSATEQARRLSLAGVRSADGFFTNVANFRTTSDEIAYGKAIINALGASNLRQVIDTSRNGAGPDPNNEWCDPKGRRIGPAPTTNTGESTVDAYLWIKPPGEADGCAASPGAFLPDYAYEMAGGANYTPNPTTPPVTTPPVTTPPVTTPPVTTPPASDPPAGSGCSVKYRIDSQWATGFVANVTVSSSTAVNGWTLNWAFGGNQTIIGFWNGAYTQSGSQVTVRNAAHNAAIPAGGSQSFGFQGSHNGTNPPAASFALNGVACSSS